MFTVVWKLALSIDFNIRVPTKKSPKPGFPLWNEDYSGLRYTVCADVDEILKEEEYWYNKK